MSRGFSGGTPAQTAQVPQKSDLPYDVRQSGVVGDGTTDDAAALAAAVTVCSGASKRTLYVPAELNVRINSQVNMQLVRRIDCQGTVTVAYTGGPGLIVGDNSVARNGAWYYFKRVVYAGSQTNVAMRVVGLKNARFTVEYCDYMQLYAEAAVSSQSSIAYTQFFLGRVPKLELYGATGTSWINENVFYGGSIDNLIIDAVTYAHNGNEWLNCSIEGSGSTVQILKGACNRIRARGEGGPQVTFGSGTWANEVIGTCLTSQGAHNTPFVLASDGGTENILASALDEKMSYRELLKIDNQAVCFDGSSEWNTSATPVPGIDKLRLRSSFGQVLDTGIFPVRGTYALDGGTNYYRNWSLLKLVFDSDTALWRPSVFAYDSAGVLIDANTTPWMSTSGGWAAQGGGHYSFGSNVQFAQITITSSSVAYLRVTVAPSSTTGTAFGWIRLMGYAPTPQPDTALEQARRSLRRSLYQAAAPTQGLAKLGQAIGGPAGVFTCVSRNDTTLSADAASGATTVTVTSATGIASGDLIGVLMDTGQTHWTTVSGAPSGTTVTLAVALTAAAATGRAVGTNRWAAPGVLAPYAAKTAAYTLTTTDEIVTADATSGAFSVTLPTAVGAAGKTYTIKRINTGSNAVTVATTSSQTIDGATNYVLALPQGVVRVISDGANWRVLAQPTAAVPTTTQSGTTYTLALADAGSAIEFTSGSATTVTVPPNSSVAFPVGAVVELVQYGAGQVTVSPGSGVTIRTPASSTTRAQYSSLGLRKRATDEWVLSGDLT